MEVKELELYITTGNEISPVGVKNLSVLSNEGEIPLTIREVKVKRCKKMFCIKVSCSNKDVDNIRKLTKLELINDHKEKVEIISINRVMVFGDNKLGYSVAKEVKASEDIVSKKVEGVRHLVVTGIHGNFKDAQKAYERASKFKGSKVIKLRA